MKKMLSLLLLGAAATSVYADQNTVFNFHSNVPNLTVTCIKAGHFASCNPSTVAVVGYTNQLASVVTLSDPTQTQPLCTIKMHDLTAVGHGHSASLELIDSIQPSVGYACYIGANKNFYLMKV